MKNTSLGVLGAGLMGKFGYTDPTSRTIGFRKLGRTGAMVSDIGTGAPTNASVLRATLNAGVNFIETSESYGSGRNEELIGDVIKDLKMFLLPPRHFQSTKPLNQRMISSSEQMPV